MRMTVMTKRTTTGKRLNVAIKRHRVGLPGGAVVENPPAIAGDTGSSPGPGRSHVLWSK